jgi:hypothetical protein
MNPLPDLLIWSMYIAGTFLVAWFAARVLCGWYQYRRWQRAAAWRGVAAHYRQNERR